MTRILFCPILCPVTWISLLLHLCPVTIDSQQVVRINILIPPPPPPSLFPLLLRFLLVLQVKHFSLADFAQMLLREQLDLRNLSLPATLPVDCWENKWPLARAKRRARSILSGDGRNVTPRLGGHVLNKTYKQQQCFAPSILVQELCESRGGRPGLSVLTSLLVSVDVKLY